MRTIPVIILLVAGFVGCDAPQEAAPTPSEPLTPIVEPPVSRPEPATTEFAGQVVGVTDGDTLDVLLADKTTVRVRFNGIDAPERGQPFGNDAK